MGNKFDFWEIYDICISESGVNLLVQSDDMTNGMCIRMTAEDALIYADQLRKMALLSERINKHLERESRNEQSRKV